MQPSGNDDPPQTPEFNRQLFTSLVQGTRQSNALPGEHEHAGTKHPVSRRHPARRCLRRARVSLC